MLSAAEVHAALSPAERIEAMRSAFGQLARGRGVMPPRTVVDAHRGNLLVMPSYLDDSGELATKLVTLFPDNAAHGLPLIQGIVVVLSAETGQPEAILDAGAVTALRTSAASALATDLLARPDASTLALFGAGVEGRAHLEVIAAVRALNEVRIFSRTRDRAEGLADDFAAASGGRTQVLVVDTATEALRGVGIVVTATTASVPLFDGRLVEPGTHVNAVGAWRPETRELDSTLMQRATIIVDQRQAAWEEAGELIQARQEGILSEQDVWAELGELVIGLRPARRTASEITLFKSVGLAVQDAAMGGAIARAAAARGLGAEVHL